jgi:DNA invertase Pin-like site-specific DNA recombinase
MDEAEAQQALLKLLQGSGADSEQAPVEDIKYALYARKSTTSEDRQERSIDDQVAECMRLQVQPHGLNVTKVIKESASAKSSGTRYHFRELIKDIENGKVTGLIAWHPDRLARNMKEAGELIDLLAKGMLKDLRFATFTFENNPTGKMLLGISFVLSQQYSDHLSESVNRGIKRTTEGGQYLGAMRQGYYITDNRELRPEEGFYSIMQEAFRKRLAGETQLSIVKWLNRRDFRVRRRNASLKPYTWDKDALSKVFRDPVYAGVLRYGEYSIVLSDFYDFDPMITVEEFLQLNKIDSLDSPKVRSLKRDRRLDTKADFLRGLVRCGYCDKLFSSGLVRKQLKSGPVFYYYYKCETRGCEFRGKSVRAKIVLDLARQFFHEYLFVTRDNYDGYVAVGKRRIAERRKDVDIAMIKDTQKLRKAQEQYDADRDLVRQNPALSAHYLLDTTLATIKDLEAAVARHTQDKAAINGTMLTFKEYLKLFESIGVILEDNNNMAQLDAIIKFFFSNFTVKQFGKGKEQRWEIDYKLKEPWQGFLDNGKFVHGRGERTRTFGLTVPNRARYQLRHTPIDAWIIVANINGFD